VTADTDFARNFVDRNVEALASLPIEEILQATALLDAARQSGARLYVVGNGGSASTASHMACDLMKATPRLGRPHLRVLCLSDNIPAVTAWANDESFDVIFEAQLRVHAEAGDVLLAVTGSGRSPNILRALTFARGAGLTTIGLLGMGGGPALELCDVSVVVDSDDYEVIENGHLVIGHLFTAFLREHGQRRS
jgi:D-sedoheptulose 7-phosphate isomerase